VPGGEVAQGGGGDGGNGVDVEFGEAFESGEFGVVDAAGAASFAAVVDFGGQDFGEVAEVGLAFPVGDVGQAGGFGAHGGQVQFSGRGADAGLCCGIDGVRFGCGVGGHGVLRFKSWS